MTVKAFRTKEGWAWSLLALMIGLISLWIAIKELESTQNALEQANELSQKKYATELITQWNKDTPGYKLRVQEQFPWLVRGNTSPNECLCSPWTGDWEALYSAGDANPDEVKLRELRNDIVWMLNYFEAVAVAYDRGLAESSIIEDSLRGLMLRWHECFGPFMMRSVEHHGANSWRPLSKRIAAWRSLQGDADESSQCVDRNPRLTSEPMS